MKEGFAQALAAQEEDLLCLTAPTETLRDNPTRTRRGGTTTPAINATFHATPAVPPLPLVTVPTANATHPTTNAVRSPSLELDAFVNTCYQQR